MTGKTFCTIAVASTFVAFFSWKVTARGAYESAEYTVLESDGSFEIREYPDLMMAVTTTKVHSQGSDGSFMRLFRYISGENDQKLKIAVTTPVLMKANSYDEQGQMGFVMPQKVREERIPEPSNEDVQVRKRAGGRFAVIRFAERIDSESFAKAQNELRSWMNDRGLVADGIAEFAGYDPPWTPGPLRRNEILIRLK